MQDDAHRFHLPLDQEMHMVGHQAVWEQKERQLGFLNREQQEEPLKSVAALNIRRRLLPRVIT
jgi:hypothetical protein